MLECEFEVILKFKQMLRALSQGFCGHFGGVEYPLDSYFNWTSKWKNDGICPVGQQFSCATNMCLLLPGNNMVTDE